jgi:tRNA-splicing ligase RtcB
VGVAEGAHDGQGHSQTEDVECRKDPGVIGEIPGAYKDIDEVMAARSDLVEILTRLRQIVSVKG